MEVFVQQHEEAFSLTETSCLDFSAKFLSFNAHLQLLLAPGHELLSAVCEVILVKESTTELAESLISIFDVQKQAVPIIKWTITKEVISTSSEYCIL
jgi:hypothetical protein